jgi:hypothetical protein
MFSQPVHEFGWNDMSVLNQIAYFQNRRNETPNQELARLLAQTQDRPGIDEIAGNLWNKNKSIRSDCLKVLYEIGYLRPDLIADYVDDFLKLLKDKDNRMVWGAMIGLATIATLRSQSIWSHIDDVIAVVEIGSVITVVWGVKTIARVASADPAYRNKLFPVLLAQLQKCIPRDVPVHAESISVTVDKNLLVPFLNVLEKRKPELTSSQFARLNRVIKKLPTI